jgi:medium-chain acyl-[acyl-carrier-protein] hydrolase
VTKSCVINFESRPNALLRMFCFSYAGGSAHAFAPLAQALPNQLEVLGVQLPGRGARMFEPPYTSLPTLINDVAIGLRPYLNKPFVLFGHSMGAVIAFELARYFRARGIPKPLHLFVSGSSSPRHRVREIMRSTLSDEGLIEELRSFNGVSAQILNDAELMRIMLPTIRADFTVCETYVYQPAPPLEIPLSAFGGVEDPEVPQERLQLWEEETKESFSLRMFPGGHFYLHTVQSLVLEALTKELTPCLETVRA